jgi:hypothetical protein
VTRPPPEALRYPKESPDGGWPGSESADCSGTPSAADPLPASGRGPGTGWVSGGETARARRARARESAREWSPETGQGVGEVSGGHQEVVKSSGTPLYKKLVPKSFHRAFPPRGLGTRNALVWTVPGNARERLGNVERPWLLSVITLATLGTWWNVLGCSFSHHPSPWPSGVRPGSQAGG